MWDALDAGEEEVAVQAQQGGRGGGGRDDVEDEDMWDLVREIEESGGATVSAVTVPASTVDAGAGVATVAAGVATTSSTTDASTSSAGQAPTPTSPKKPATNDEGWDEMYL